MFATPLTAVVATRVKSGPAATTGGGVSDAGRCASGAGAAGGSAGSTAAAGAGDVSAAARVRLVTVNPAANPSTISRTGIATRLTPRPPAAHRGRQPSE